MTITDLKTLHIDREKETEIFVDMLTGPSNKHILLIKADAGMGKSRLLQDVFWEKAADHPIAFIDLKGISESWDVLTSLADSLKRNQFVEFNREMDKLLREINITVNKVTQISSKMDVKINLEDVRIHDSHRDILTRHFFSDLAAIHNQDPRRIVFLIDTYEQANPEIQKWISSTFLRWIRNYPWLVVVVAGREIPEQTIPWKDYSLGLTLSAFSLEHVREYTQRVELNYSDESITLLYTITSGIPSDLALHIEKILMAKGAQHG